MTVSGRKNDVELDSNCFYSDKKLKVNRSATNVGPQMGAIGSRSGKSGVSSTGENIPQENFDIQVSCSASKTESRSVSLCGDSRPLVAPSTCLRSRQYFLVKQRGMTLVRETADAGRVF